MEGFRNMIKILNGVKETVSFEEDSYLMLFDNIDFEEYPPHWHTPIEIIMPEVGGYEIECNGKAFSLREQDIVIIPPGALHHLLAAEGRRIIFQADLSKNPIFNEFESFLSFIQPSILITPEDFPVIHEELVSLMRGIADEYLGNAPLKDAAIYSKLLKFLILIARVYTAPEDRFTDIKPNKQQEYIEKFMSICKFINDHCTEDLTLEGVAAEAGFSKYHFSRLFKDFTGTTFYKYLNSRRIAYAESLLLDPEINITEAAVRSGYNSISAFMRMFKLVKGCTPTEFRKLHQI